MSYLRLEVCIWGHSKWRMKHLIINNCIYQSSPRTLLKSSFMSYVVIFCNPLGKFSREVSLKIYAFSVSLLLFISHNNNFSNSLRAKHSIKITRSLQVGLLLDCFIIFWWAAINHTKRLTRIQLDILSALILKKATIPVPYEINDTSHILKLLQLRLTNFENYEV